MESAQWLGAFQGQPWELLGRLVAAAVLGGAIGVEREAKDQSAGLRTNMLVSLGSCLFTILSIVSFPVLDAGDGPDGNQGAIRDSARVAAQIVSGIGFLGAGALFRDGDTVRGMTTAATIWLVAAIGMAAGAGSYFIAIAATLLALIVLVLLRPLSAAVAPSDRHQN